MIESDFWAKIVGFGIFYRWHPAVALRYLPIVKKIEKMENVKNILEVGSGGLGICPYLRREVTGLDADFKPPFHPFLKQVKGSAGKLPFPDDSFDIVLSVDMLEHIGKRDRRKAVREMIRVAKKRIFLGVPSGKQSYEQDKALDSYFANTLGERHQFLKEHVHEGLPSKEEVRKMLGSSADSLKKNIQLHVIGNENLAVREFLMKGWMTRNFLQDIFFRKILLLAIPILRLLDRPPYYRQLFIVQII